jgi:hypothetical protein
VPVLVKRLVDNELGLTGGHQRGGILVPKSCVSFFPNLGEGENPETTLDVYYPAVRSFENLRFIYYNQETRDEYRLTPVPDSVLQQARAGDLFVLSKTSENEYSAEVITTGDTRHSGLESELGGYAGRVISDNAWASHCETEALAEEEGGEPGAGQGIAPGRDARRAIEQYAMDAAKSYYERAGYSVDDISATEPCDLLCRRANDVLYVEVKGTQSSGEEVLLTPNEVRFAEEHTNTMSLFVLHSAELTMSEGGISVEGGSTRVVEPWDIGEGELIPAGYRYRLPPQ